MGGFNVTFMDEMDNLYFFFIYDYSCLDGVQHVIDDYIKFSFLKTLINIIFLLLTLAQLIYLPYFLLVIFNG